MPTYVVDNGQSYSLQALYFVEAPDDFGQWLEQVLVPWLKDKELEGQLLKVCGTCDEVHWLVRDRTTMSLHDFLNDSSIVSPFDYLEPPHQPRPRYREEVQ
jgi:hypothetical protein